MSFTADQYKQQLKQLLPPGRALDFQPDSNLDNLIGALSQEYARFDARCDDLLQEAIPDKSIEMLSDWETLLGLPDPCIGTSGTLAQRQAAVKNRLKYRKSTATAANIIQAAANLGYTVTVNGFNAFTCESPCTMGIRDETWRFVWQVNAPATTVVYSTCESFCTDPLEVWGNTYLECEISNFDQAHTAVIFNYS